MSMKESLSLHSQLFLVAIGFLTSAYSWQHSTACNNANPLCKSKDTERTYVLQSLGRSGSEAFVIVSCTHAFKLLTVVSVDFLLCALSFQHMTHWAQSPLQSHSSKKPSQGKQRICSWWEKNILEGWVYVFFLKMFAKRVLIITLLGCMYSFHSNEMIID